ncbi:calcium-binding and coiled-coil domain-containing protein 1b isoform X1 [Osmerus mordax]|uniref:calcium-binding and coiled-coil domain-containing protein 1b isoform X1 n=2 Tax=Osmerus mordax TaxID=8014 RepID=UPI00350FEAE7
METQYRVMFRNVGQLYFPQSRVECHYSLTSKHQWSNKDWIGMFKVGWSSVKDYYTFSWALAPEGYIEGTNVNCCVHFQAFYLPQPSEVEYQFVYVDENGKICGCSRQFTFCAPKPLDELETLEEERDGDEEGDGEMEDLLLVVPRAQLLQSRLEECLRERDNLQLALEKSKKEKEIEIDKSEKAKMEWEKEKEEMKEGMKDLRGNLKHSWDKIEKIEGKHKDVQYSQETLSTELSGLLAAKTESKQQIRELEDDITALTGRGKETEAELERMKERVKKMYIQRKDEELEKKNLHIENHEALEELRGLRDRLEASERGAEALRRELCELGVQQSHTHAELHQMRLQAAQLTLQLSETNLSLREGRANWAQEREAFKQAAETDKDRIQKMSREAQRKEEWLQEERLEREKLEVELNREKDCNRVQLSNARKEVQELRTGLRIQEKEGELQTMEKQDLLDYIRQLEQRLETVADDRWTEAALLSSTPESLPEQDLPPAGALVLSPYDDYPDRVNSPTQPDSLHHNKSDDKYMEKDEMEPHHSQRCSEEKPLILSDHTDSILSELADSPLW